MHPSTGTCRATLPVHLLISLPMAPFFRPFLFLMNSSCPLRATTSVSSSSIRRWCTFWSDSVLVSVFLFLAVDFSEAGPQLTPFLVEPLAWHLTPKSHSLIAGTHISELFCPDFHTFVTHRLSQSRCTKTKFIFFPETQNLWFTLSNHADSKSQFPHPTMPHV